MPDWEIEEAGAEDDAQEWVQLLGGNEPSAPTKTSAVGKHMGSVVGGFDEGSDGEDWTGDLETVKVTSEGDAAALLRAVKEVLESSGLHKQYYEFLAAISADTVDHEAALAILEGHDDLKYAFRRCYTGVAIPNVGSAQDHRSAEARVSQLARLIFANHSGRDYEETKLCQYITKKSGQAVFPRRLFLLRGPTGLGKAQYALQVLKQEGTEPSGSGRGEALAMQLAHVCSTDDFFMRFTSHASSELQYHFNPNAVEACHIMNEARVQLAMEVGLEPLFIANENLTPWEMRPYVMLADRLGYVVTVVSPSKIHPNWNDINFLVTKNTERKQTDRLATKPVLEAALKAFQDLPGKDPRPAIRNSKAPESGPKPAKTTAALLTLLTPSTMLYKFERLLKEGSQLMGYTPPDGKGWGVNGELCEEWHSFKEQADGSCCYDDGSIQWTTNDPESGWSFAELAWLQDIRRKSEELPKAALPSSVSHPGLFTKADTVDAKPIALQPNADSMATIAQKKSAKLASRAMAEAYVPTSRAERLKHKMQTAAVSAPPKGSPPAREMPQAKVRKLDVPAATEEKSELTATTFLSAVKARFFDWQQMDVYQEFVSAISGDVDAKACVRLLRGHDDLIAGFRRIFTPRVDLSGIQAEIAEVESEAPRPPSHPPSFGSKVKQELHEGRALSTPFTPDGVSVGPTPPGGAPPAHLRGNAALSDASKKRDIVKAELTGEDAPRPPSFAPGSRQTVTVGDESDPEAADEELLDEASIAAAVRKGRDACVAELAKTIFKKERANHEGIRQRLAVVHYATKRAACLKFPRELFILRGTPGLGKTDYAMQQLADSIGYSSTEALAVRLTHCCAADDFFEEFTADGTKYKFESGKVEAYHKRNELRTRWAMEAGIHPLYVDCSNMRLWEMRPYVLLADRLGYVVTVVEPQELSEKWDDVQFLVTANDTADRQETGKTVSRSQLQAMTKAFEPIPIAEDPLDSIRESMPPEGGRRRIESMAPPPSVARVSQKAKGDNKDVPRAVPATAAGIPGAAGAKYPRQQIKEEVVRSGGHKRPQPPSSGPTSRQKVPPPPTMPHYVPGVGAGR